MTVFQNIILIIDGLERQVSIVDLDSSSLSTALESTVLFIAKSSSDFMVPWVPIV